MSDIYKQKAEKYKYKYLKLKKELEGGEYHYNSCIITPPINFFELIKKDLIKKDLIKVDYRDNNNDINSFNNNNFVGRLIKSKKRT